MIPSLNGNSILSGKSKKNNDIVYRYLQLKHKYLQSKYAVVLVYMPGKKTEYNDYSDAMLPEGNESVHPLYAISWRNNWMPGSQILLSPTSATLTAAQHSVLKKQK